MLLVKQEKNFLFVANHRQSMNEGATTKIIANSSSRQKDGSEDASHRVYATKGEEEQNAKVERLVRSREKWKDQETKHSKLDDSTEDMDCSSGSTSLDLSSSSTTSSPNLAMNIVAIRSKNDLETQRSLMISQENPPLGSKEPVDPAFVERDVHLRATASNPSSSTLRAQRGNKAGAYYPSTQYKMSSRNGCASKLLVGATIGGDLLDQYESLDESEITLSTLGNQRRSKWKHQRHNMSSSRTTQGSSLHNVAVQPPLEKGRLIESPHPLPTIRYESRQEVEDTESSVDVWSLDDESASVPMIFSVNRKRYVHPAMPPGWEIKVSKSRQRPYYVHPDWGTTWRCPVVLPPKSQSSLATLLKRQKNRKSFHPFHQHSKTGKSDRRVTSAVSQEDNFDSVSSFEITEAKLEKSLSDVVNRYERNPLRFHIVSDRPNAPSKLEKRSNAKNKIYGISDPMIELKTLDHPSLTKSCGRILTPTKGTTSRLLPIEYDGNKISTNSPGKECEMMRVPLPPSVKWNGDKVASLYIPKASNSDSITTRDCHSVSLERKAISERFAENRNTLVNSNEDDAPLSDLLRQNLVTNDSNMPIMNATKKSQPSHQHIDFCVDKPEDKGSNHPYFDSMEAINSSSKLRRHTTDIQGSTNLEAPIKCEETSSPRSPKDSSMIHSNSVPASKGLLGIEYNKQQKGKDFRRAFLQNGVIENATRVDGEYTPVEIPKKGSDKYDSTSQMSCNTDNLAVVGPYQSRRYQSLQCSRKRKISHGELQVVRSASHKKQRDKLKFVSFLNASCGDIKKASEVLKDENEWSTIRETSNISVSSTKSCTNEIKKAAQNEKKRHDSFTKESSNVDLVNSFEKRNDNLLEDLDVSLSGQLIRKSSEVSGIDIASSAESSLASPMRNAFSGTKSATDRLNYFKEGTKERHSKLITGLYNDNVEGEKAKRDSRSPPPQVPLPKFLGGMIANNANPNVKGDDTASYMSPLRYEIGTPTERTQAAVRDTRGILLKEHCTRKKERKNDFSIRSKESISVATHTFPSIIKKQCDLTGSSRQKGNKPLQSQFLEIEVSVPKATRSKSKQMTVLPKEVLVGPQKTPETRRLQDKSIQSKLYGNKPHDSRSPNDYKISVYADVVEESQAMREGVSLADMSQEADLDSKTEIGYHDNIAIELGSVLRRRKVIAQESWKDAISKQSDLELNTEFSFQDDTSFASPNLGDHTTSDFETRPVVGESNTLDEKSQQSDLESNTFAFQDGASFVSPSLGDKTTIDSETRSVTRRMKALDERAKKSNLQLNNDFAFHDDVSTTTQTTSDDETKSVTRGSEVATEFSAPSKSTWGYSWRILHPPHPLCALQKLDALLRKQKRRNVQLQKNRRRRVVTKNSRGMNRRQRGLKDRR
jgi:hypothetical protein